MADPLRVPAAVYVRLRCDTCGAALGRATLIEAEGGWRTDRFSPAVVAESWLERHAKEHSDCVPADMKPQPGAGEAWS